MANNKLKVQLKVETKNKGKKFTPKMSSNNGGLLTAKVIASIKKAKDDK